jgi:5'-nucleotidase
MLEQRTGSLRRTVLKILISNDDGIKATGIRVLAERLASEKNHDVYVVAPDRERSATGHSLTIHKPLWVDEVDDIDNVKGAWSTTGTPSDCVKLAVMELLPVQPDIVISGINSGPNLGSEILYSGTVAAAMEGAFLKFPSIAVSLVSSGKDKLYETAAEVIARLLEVYPQAHLAPRTLLNVNVPNVALPEIKGVAITEVGVRLYDDFFEKRTDPRGRVYYWLAGHAVEEGESEESDTHAVNQNMVSISPVAFNMTDKPAIAKLAALQELHKLHESQPTSRN